MLLPAWQRIVTRCLSLAEKETDREVTMSLIHASEEELRVRTELLRQVTELLMWELATISDRRWEDLPELKRRKSQMAARLREFDWAPDAGETDMPLA